MPSSNSSQKSGKTRAKARCADKPARPQKMPSPHVMHALVALVNGGRLPEAAKIAQDLTVRFPMHGFGWKVLGVVFKQMGRNEEALLPMQKAVALLPNDSEAHSNLGVTLKNVGRLVDAERSFRRALQIKPDFAEARYNLANTLKELGRLNDAETCYLEAIKLRPLLSEAYSNLSLVLRDRGELALSVGYLDRVIQLKNDYAEAHLNKGTVLLQMKQREKAKVSFSRALEINPGYVEAYSGLGIALNEMQRLDEAETCCRRALQLNAANIEAYISMSAVLMNMGRLSEAESVFRQALQLKPDHIVALSNLSVIALKQGRLIEAENICRQLMAVNTESDSSCASTSTPVTALLPFGRSGSLFFHSLFDGHPELATLPGIYFKGWFDRERWKNLLPDMTAQDWREQLVERIVKAYQPMFDACCNKNVPGKPLGDSAWLAKNMGFMEMGADHSAPFVVDQNVFSATFLSFLAPVVTINQKDCFELIHRSFEMTVRGNTNSAVQNRHIFYHIHNPGLTEFLPFLQNYPQARILYIVRAPIQGMESWMLMDYTSGARNWSVDQDIDTRMEDNIRICGWDSMVDKVHTMLRQMQSPINRVLNCKGVRLEDVKRDPKRVMPQIAAWMGISDHPALYEASFCGLQYWGPTSKTTGKITGFDTKAIDQPVGRLLGPRDVVIFETLFWPFSHLYGYTDLDAAGFRRQLAEIRPWLDEPLEFEMKLYAELPDHTRALEDLPPYKRLHHLLHQYWAVLDRDGTYHGMVQPLELG